MPPVLSFFFNLNQILRNRIGLETSWESQAAQRHSVSQCAVVLERRQTNSVPSPLSWLRRQGSERLGEWKPGCGASASASERLPANRHPPPPAPAPRARPPEAELSPTKIIQIRDTGHVLGETCEQNQSGEISHSHPPSATQPSPRARAQQLPAPAGVHATRRRRVTPGISFRQKIK
jgi:hypothetical protein